MIVMRSKREPQSLMDDDAYRELRLLTEVDKTSESTQRDLSKRVGIALGITNVLLRNLSQKGYIRVTQAGWKRWLYALTPAGLSRKIQLTAAYVHRVLDHYQKVRQTLREELELLNLNEESRLAIYGTGEFAELVYLGLREMTIEEIDIFGPVTPGNGRFLGIPVRDVVTLQPDQYDRVVVAVLNGPHESYGLLQDLGVDEDQLVTFFPNNRLKVDA